jgi:hypothetical protein
MGSIDRTIAIVFGTLAFLALAGSVFAFWRAFKVSSHKDADLKMFLWALAGMFGLIVAGMSAAYFLLPLLFFHW